MNMFTNLILLLIGTVIVLVNGVIDAMVSVKSYGVRIWKNNVMRKWVLDFMDLMDVLFRRFENYLEELISIIQFRIMYEKISGPMMNYYRELKKRKI
jgi:hypothetical protein